MSSQRSQFDESRLRGSSDEPKLINFFNLRPRMLESSDELKIRNQMYIRRLALKVKEILEENWINDFPYFSIFSSSRNQSKLTQNKTK